MLILMFYLEITRRAPTLQEGQGASGAQPPALPIVLKQRARNAARDVVCGRARGGEPELGGSWACEGRGLAGASRLRSDVGPKTQELVLGPT